MASRFVSSLNLQSATLSFAAGYPDGTLRHHGGTSKANQWRNGRKPTQLLTLVRTRGKHDFPSRSGKATRIPSSLAELIGCLQVESIIPDVSMDD